MEYLKINSISDKLPLDVIVSAPEHPKAIFQIVHVDMLLSYMIIVDTEKVF